MWGKDDIPEWTAVLAVSMMMFANLFFLMLLAEFVGIRGVAEFTVDNTLRKTIIIFIMMVLAGLNYFLFMHSEKYKSIAREYEKEDSDKRNVNTCLLWLYITLSILSPILLMVLIKNKYYS